MLTIAHFANLFPAAVEPYVSEQIEELRRRGIRVFGGSARKSKAPPSGSFDANTVFLQPVRWKVVVLAMGVILWRWKRIADLLAQVIWRGNETPTRRLKAVLHTFLGAYYAVLLRERGVAHIHVHHGYFGSWIGMVAARLLDISFSVTLYGSDLLLGAAYLDTKLESCRFCATISAYNRSYLLKHFPGIDPRKVMVSRMGVNAPERAPPAPIAGASEARKFTLLAVGRLHPVKDHAFLIRACARLRDEGLDFECAIVGEGPERKRLEALVREHRLQDRLTLHGFVTCQQRDLLYQRADVVVLTSRSEGIPVVLIEAMARGKIVLAPAITGIPELVIPGKTGFLYPPGRTEKFVSRIVLLQQLARRNNGAGVGRLDWIRHAARVHVLHNFNHKENLTTFTDRFLQAVSADILQTHNP